MSKQLPPRPNLDHLREQAKDLLSHYRKGDPAAYADIAAGLPAAAGKSVTELANLELSLSDAQSAVARLYGFESWPRLARHVEALRAIEGIWRFLTLEIEGNAMPPGTMDQAMLQIHGNRFTMTSPEAVYEGWCHLDVEASPATIDIHFTDGPEKGNSSFGIYELVSEDLKICLGFTGIPRPNAFATAPGTGLALETLRRGAPAIETAPEVDPASFSVLTPESERLQGEWSAVSLENDGMIVPDSMLASAKRTSQGTETKAILNGQTIIHALTRIDPTHDPIWIDYLSLRKSDKDQIRYGIMKWEGDQVTFCFAKPGKPRPEVFAAPAGSGFTLSTWKPNVGKADAP